jgi:putative Holliday junction resolvase
MRVVALDYGQVRTGVATCDPTGTIVRPVGVVEHVDQEPGFERLLDVLEIEGPELVVVGLPVSLDGREHAQAGRARAFARRLEERSPYTVALYDERFTTTVAQQRGGTAPLDARGAAVILEDYLRSHGPSSG